MNIGPHDWDLQERALREDPAWREVARALRRSPGEPPADFAASVAARVEARAQAARAPREGAAERVFVRVLGAALGVVGAAMVLRVDDAWLGAVRGGFGVLAAALGGPTALNWAAAAGACMALSWLGAQGAARSARPRR